MDLPEPEVPTRVCKQLTKLAISLTLIRSHDAVMEEDMNAVRRVAKDTALPKRQRIIDIMLEYDYRNGFTILDLSGLTKIGYNTIKRECKKMMALGILEFEVDEEKDSIVNYKFIDHFGNIAKSVRFRGEVIQSRNEIEQIFEDKEA